MKQDKADAASVKLKVLVVNETVTVIPTVDDPITSGEGTRGLTLNCAKYEVHTGGDPHGEREVRLKKNNLLPNVDIFILAKRPPAVSNSTHYSLTPKVMGDPENLDTDNPKQM
jgi:hypothetical protein